MYNLKEKLWKSPHTACNIYLQVAIPNENQMLKPRKHVTGFSFATVFSWNAGYTTFVRIRHANIKEI